MTVQKTVYLGDDSGAGCPTPTDDATGVADGYLTYCLTVANTGGYPLDVAVTDTTLGIGHADVSLLSGANPVPVDGTAVWYYDGTLTSTLANVHGNGHTDRRRR